MKMVSVFNSAGDEIRVTPDMLDYYTSIGWNQVGTAKAVDAEVVEEVISEEFE